MYYLFVDKMISENDQMLNGVSDSIMPKFPDK
jgi:hypothetical protein